MGKKAKENVGECIFFNTTKTQKIPIYTPFDSTWFTFSLKLQCPAKVFACQFEYAMRNFGISGLCGRDSHHLPQQTANT